MVNKKRTKQRATEKALKRSEENYRAIFELANDAMIIRDIKTYKITDANNKACEMFCYSEEEMKGLPLESFSVDFEGYSAEKLKIFYAMAAKGEPQLLEWLIKDKFGREFWVEVNIKRAIIGGRYQLLSIARDITERKQLAEQRDSFMNMVSHELRTPLGAIKESVSLVLEGKAGPIDGKQKEMIDITKRNVDRLSRLIDQVLDLQKIDAGRMEFRLYENDMNETIKEVYDAMLPFAKKKGLSLILKVDDKLPRIKFDRERIIQVLTDLVNNAIKFTEKGSITITSEHGNNFVKISVNDTGPGITAEDMPKLFQRFSQLKRKPGGTGLGLAVSKEIIEMHRGKIEVASEVGRGAVFSFFLPIKERRV